MNILIASFIFLPTLGGAELMIDSLARSLSNKNKIITVFSKSSQNISNAINYKVSWVPKNLSYFLLPLFFLYVCYKHKIHLINVHVAIPTTLPFFLVKFTRKPIIVTTHGKDIQTDVKIKYGLYTRKSRIAYVFAHRIATKVIIGNPYVKNDLKGFPINFKKFKVIKPFVDIKIQKQKAKLIDKLSGKIKIVFYSRLHIKKGLSDLLIAWNNIPLNIRQDACLLIFGRGDISIYSNLMNKTDIFYYNLPREDILSILPKCDVFCVPSKKESFGLVFLEAKAAGLPLVAYNITPINKIITHNYDGLLVPLNNLKELTNTLIKIIQDTSLRKKLAEHSKKTFRNVKNTSLVSYANLFNAFLMSS